MTAKKSILSFRLNSYLHQLRAQVNADQSDLVVPTKTELAQVAGVHITTLARWSSGEIQKLDSRKMQAMLDLFNERGFPATPNDLLHYRFSGSPASDGKRESEDLQNSDPSAL
jgi:hypothetical protein